MIPISISMSIGEWWVFGRILTDADNQCFWWLLLLFGYWVYFYMWCDGILTGNLYIELKLIGVFGRLFGSVLWGYSESINGTNLNGVCLGEWWAFGRLLRWAINFFWISIWLPILFIYVIWYYYDGQFLRRVAIGGRICWAVWWRLMRLYWSNRCG